MFCPKCGSQNMDTSAFCCVCGTQLPNNIIPVAPQGYINPAPVPVQQAPVAPVVQQTPVAQQAPVAPATQQPAATPVQQPVEIPVAPATQQPAATPIQQPVEIPAAPVTPVTQQPVETPVTPVTAPATPVVQQTPVAPTYDTISTAVPSSFEAAPVAFDKKPKSHKSGKALAIIGAVLVGLAVIIAIVVLLFGSKITNFFMRTFASPEAYYAYVQKNEISEIVDTGKNFYDAYKNAFPDIDDYSTELSVNVELGNKGKDLVKLADAAGVDLNWLDSVSGRLKFISKSGNFGLSAAVGLNDNDLLSADAVIDTENMFVYMIIPELSNQYLRVALSDSMNRRDMNQILDAKEELKTFSQVYSSLPSGSELSVFAKKYATTFAKNLDVASKSKTNLTVEGVKEAVYVLDIQLTDEAMSKATAATLKQIYNDKDFKKFVLKHLSPELMEAAGIQNLDAESVYEKMMEEIDDAISHLENRSYSDSFPAITMKVYVNKDGKIIGRELKNEYQTVSLVMTTNNGNFGFYASVGSNFVVTGNGTKSNSEKLTGTFALSSVGNQLMEFKLEDFDIKEYKKGHVVGAIEYVLPEEAANVIGKQLKRETGLNINSIVDLSSLTFRFDIDSKASDITLKITIFDNDDSLLAITTNSASSKGSIDIPRDYVDTNNAKDAQKYLSSLNLNGLLDKLEDCGVPTEYVTLLRRAISVYLR